jgi:HK97 family phage prohead protease
VIVRNKSGEFNADCASVLLEYLGVTKKAAGRVKIGGDVEVIAPVPFFLIKGEGDGEEGAGQPWILSTYDLDRYGERIDPAGWDYKRFLENPVVQWAHNYLIPAIGRMEGLTVNEKGLQGEVVFNSREIDPFGWAIGERVKAGVIRAGSVGFRPVEIEIPSAADSKDGTALIFRKQELLEFSICNVPANPFALAKAEDNGQGSNASPFWGGLIPFSYN